MKYIMLFLFGEDYKEDKLSNCKPPSGDKSRILPPRPPLPKIIWNT